MRCRRLAPSPVRRKRRTAAWDFWPRRNSPRPARGGLSVRPERIRSQSGCRHLAPQPSHRAVACGAPCSPARHSSSPRFRSRSRNSVRASIPARAEYAAATAAAARRPEARNQIRRLRRPGLRNGFQSHRQSTPGRARRRLHRGSSSPSGSEHIRPRAGGRPPATPTRPSTPSRSCRDPPIPPTARPSAPPPRPRGGGTKPTNLVPGFINIVAAAGSRHL